MGRFLRAFGALIFGCVACSSNPSPAASGPPAATAADDSGSVSGEDASGSSPADASAPPALTDAPEGGAPAPADAAALPVADMAAGKAGADAFCNQICNHEQHCATTLDASPPGLANCVSDCQSANESSTTEPPTELLRADYVSALGACIAARSCSEDLQTSETACASAIQSGSADAGGAPLKPTAAVAGLCHELETSPCVADDSGVQDCVTAFMFFSDQALNAATTCFSSASCAQAASCYAAALMQM